MRFKQGFLFLAVLFLVGCQSEKPDLDIISKGVKDTKASKEAHQSIDKNSYAEILPYLQDNSVIQSDGEKGILLMFGSNGCKYCDKLKDEIKDNAGIAKLIKDSYFSYYINISYQKTHRFKNQEMDTQMLAEGYSIRSTPTLIFLNPQGEMIFKVVGFLGGEKLKIALEFIRNNLNLSEDEIAEKLYNLYSQKSLL